MTDFKLFYASVSYRMKGDRKRTYGSGAVIARNEEEAIAKFKSIIGHLPPAALEIDYKCFEEEKGAFVARWYKS